MLELLAGHNDKVDRYTRKFSQNDLLLEELSKLPQFQTEEQQVLPAGLDGSLDNHQVEQLNKIKEDEEMIEYLEANMNQLTQAEKRKLDDLLHGQQRRRVKEAMAAKEKVEDVLTKLEYRLALVGRHNLDYSILYHDRHGGYDMEKLTQVLKDMKEDRE